MMNVCCQVTIEIVITTDLLVTVMSDTMTITATPGRGRGSATTRTGTGTRAATGRIGTEKTDTERTGTGTTGEKPCLILPRDVMKTNYRYERPPRDYYERDRGYDRYGGGGGGGGGGHYPSSSSRRSASPGPPPRY